MPAVPARSQTATGWAETFRDRVVCVCSPQWSRASRGVGSGGWCDRDAACTTANGVHGQLPTCVPCTSRVLPAARAPLKRPAGRTAGQRAERGCHVVGRRVVLHAAKHADLDPCWVHAALRPKTWTVAACRCDSPSLCLRLSPLLSLLFLSLCLIYLCLSLSLLSSRPCASRVGASGF